ncbi:CusA/CzcA family heavy metal efflux RND transporter [Sulfurimonas sp. C5]|uniref:efflux RND transporter permease subunit n=1 Tax=Sulfurimonas sp. C5 TaxID=3036947 RepID=UPI00245399F6|nr:CusA/CzcA family heavy metal efflux RND transporter [Sulfurimonas sp. C5]MDH4945226.1 CusA/CzcA family heavy metal efflux RND transporter [Sulfurimonas sp. C5]
MIEKLIGIALQQRVLALIIALALAVGGVFSYSKLTIDAFPDVSTTQVKIIIKSPGMTPKEIEQQITIPIELEMQGIPHQKIVRSISKYALADITIDFEEGTDLYWARDRVYQRFNNIKNSLPATMSGGIAPVTTPLGEILMFTIESDTLSLMEKRTLLDWVIRPSLRNIEGVADVNALGGEVQTFRIKPDFAAMASLGLTLENIENKIEKNNANFGAGRIERGDEALLVRLPGSMKNSDSLSNLVIRVDENGAIVRLKDIAQVATDKLTRYGYVTKDGKGEAVEGLVLGLKGADASRVTSQVKQRLDELESNLPEGTKIKIFYDRKDLISKAVNMVQKSLTEAIILVLIILFLFLGSFVSAITVALILPLSILSAFICMYYFGISVNLMSLGGIAIAIGMIVDSGVVLVENVIARLSEERNESRLHTIYVAAKEVSTPIISGVFIIIIVFTPLLMLQGLGGKLFAPVALSIVFTLASAIFLALFVIPTIASFLIRKVSHEETWLMKHLIKWYEPLLHKAFKAEKFIYTLLAVLLVGTFFAFSTIGKTFMPTMDEGNIVIGVETPPSINIPAGITLATEIQKKLMQEIPEIKSIIARTGSDEIGLDPMGLNDTDTFLVFKPKEEWRKQDVEWLKEQMRKTLEEIQGIEYGFTQPIEMRTSEMLTGARGDVVIKVFGEEIDKLNELGTKIKEITQHTQGSEDVYMRQNEGAAYQELRFNEEKLGNYGLDKSDVAHLLQAAVSGVEVGTIYQGMKQFSIVVKGDYKTTNLDEIYLVGSMGEAVSLLEVVDIVRSSGPVEIKHEKARRFVSIQTNVSGTDLVTFVDNLKANIAKDVELPSGYSLTFGGEFKNQQATMSRLSLVVPIALVLIFMTLYMTFKSIVQSIIIFTTIPLAMMGGIFGLYLTNSYLSVPASVGFIALLGIAVLNGVVMVSYFNELAQTMNIKDVVIQGAKRRLRPVLMTATIAALSLVPMLFATGPGSEIQKPLAIVVIFGLISSTALTLVLLPMLYKRFIKENNDINLS